MKRELTWVPPLQTATPEKRKDSVLRAGDSGVREGTDSSPAHNETSTSAALEGQTTRGDI